MLNTRQINMATSNTRYGPWTNTSCSLEELYTRFSVPLRSAEIRASYLSMPKKQQDNLKDVGGFVGGTLTSHQRRSGNVMCRSLITLDIDKVVAGGTPDVIRKIETLGCGFAVYSTRKHAPEAPRLRAIIPLHTDLSSDEYEPCARLIAYLIDPTMQMFDRTTFEPVRLMYWPSVCADGEYVWYCADKPLLDGKGLLSQYVWHDVGVWPRCPDEGEILRKEMMKQTDPETKDGLVGAFCRVYDVHSAMDDLLPGVYEPCGNDDSRYTFVGGSTTGGAVVYENGKFIFSHHGTDPASGHLCNAFDLVRLHLYASLDTDIRVGTPPNKMPSFMAMCERVKSDQKVCAQVIEDRLSDIREDFGLITSIQDNPIPVAQAPTEPQEVHTEMAPVGSGPTRGPVSEERARELAAVLDERVPVTTSVVDAVLELMGISVRTNIISNRAEVGGMPQQFSVQERGNTLLVCISDALKKRKITASPSSLKPYIAAISDVNRYNPVAEWLDGSGNWDGVDRIFDIYAILGIDGDWVRGREVDRPLDPLVAQEDMQSYRTYVSKWLQQCIALAYSTDHDPVSAQGALVLQGAQGSGKTLFFRSLVPARGWFVEGLKLDMGNKDSIIKALGGWITELGELDSTFRKEQMDLKAFITQTVDTVRAPYADVASDRVRRTSFCGSVNPEEFLKDQSGSRRWLTVPVGSIDIPRLLSLDTHWKAQLWLQVRTMWMFNPDGFRLTTEEIQKLESRNARFKQVVDLEDEVLSILDFSIPEQNWVEVTPGRLAALLGVSQGSIKVGNALGSIASKDRRIHRRRSKYGNVWRVPLDPKYLIDGR